MSGEDRSGGPPAHAHLPLVMNAGPVVAQRRREAREAGARVRNILTRCTPCVYKWPTLIRHERRQRGEEHPLFPYWHAVVMSKRSTNRPTQQRERGKRVWSSKGRVRGRGTDHMSAAKRPPTAPERDPGIANAFYALSITFYLYLSTSRPRMLIVVAAQLVRARCQVAGGG